MQFFLLNHFRLEPAGQADIRLVHANKDRILRLYGPAFLLYKESCYFLKEQLDERYGDMV